MRPKPKVWVGRFYSRANPHFSTRCDLHCSETLIPRSRASLVATAQVYVQIVEGVDLFGTALRG